MKFENVMKKKKVLFGGGVEVGVNGVELLVSVSDE